MKKNILITAVTLISSLSVIMHAQAAEKNSENVFVDVPSLIEQGKLAGIDHKYTGPFEYFVGGGVASFDCNGDRMPDVFLAGGESSAKLYINKSTPSGDLVFEEKSIFDDGKYLKKVTGAYAINLNNDAHTDLVVMRVGKNYLLKGGKDCTFTKANKEFVFDGGKAWTTGFSAKWEKDASFPTLAFANYIDRRAPNSPWGTCDDNRIVRSGNKVAEFSENLALSPSYCSLSALFTDWNNTGKFDLRVTNDRQYHRGGQEQLWSVEAGKKPKAYGAKDGWRKLIIWGMGISEADLNGDGRPEYALSSMGDTMLQSIDEEAEEDQPIYRDIAFEKGSTAHRPYHGGDLKPSTGWHTEFADFNNDGRSDLFIAKGNVAKMSDFAAYDPDNLLLGTITGKFVERGVEAGIAISRKGRGAVVEDFNADGQLDLLVVNREDQVSLFKNQGVKTDWGHKPLGNFVSVELNNGDINKKAIGAKISVKTGNLVQTKTVQIGGGHASGHLGFLHFGLGVAERAQIRIKWPGGSWSQPYKVFANNFVVIEKGDPVAKYWYPN